MEEFEQYYPPKPILKKENRKKHLSITVLSIILFAVTFSLIIDDYVFIALLLGVLLFHELGHYSIMKLFGYENLNMLFIPFIGAMVSGSKKKYSQREVVIMVLAGPIPGIVIGSILLIYFNASYLAIEVGVMMVLLNVLNLIPTHPLDGGQFVRTLFVKNYPSYELVQLIINVISSLGIAVLGVFINSWFVIVLGFLLGVRLRGKHRVYLIHKEMKREAIDMEANYATITDKKYARISSIVTEYSPSIRKMGDEFGETEDYQQLMASQVDQVLYPPLQRDASLFFKIGTVLVWLGGILISIYSLSLLDINTVVHAFQIGG